MPLFIFIIVQDMENKYQKCMRFNSAWFRSTMAMQPRSLNELRGLSKNRCTSFWAN